MSTSHPRLMDRVSSLKSSVNITTLIAETLTLKRDGSRWVGLCPFHADHTPSFYTFDDRRYRCFGCSAHGDVFDWLQATKGLSLGEAVDFLDGGYTTSAPRTCPSPTPRSAPPRSPPATSGIFMSVWDQGVDAAGTIVETYLASRGGLTIPEDAPIRFMAECQRGARSLPDGPEYLPAMLALMTDPVTGRPTGLHRTYLLPDGSGKAPVTQRSGVTLKSKSILGSWGVVRLHPCEGRAVAVAEGIENALTAAQILNWGPAVWAAGTQDCVRRLPVLDWAEALAVFADADDAGVGVSAANECAARWSRAGREVYVHIPPAGKDWNDVCRERGA